MMLAAASILLRGVYLSHVCFCNPMPRTDFNSTSAWRRTSAVVSRVAWMRDRRAAASILGERSRWNETKEGEGGRFRGGGARVGWV
jgi:hypothetical protein